MKTGPLRNASYWIFLHGLLSLLFNTSHEQVPQGDTAYSRLGSCASIFNQEKCLHRRAYRPSWCIFSVEIPSSQMALAYVKLTKLSYTTDPLTHKYNTIKPELFLSCFLHVLIVIPRYVKCNIPSKVPHSNISNMLKVMFF